MPKRDKLTIIPKTDTHLGIGSTSWTEQALVEFENQFNGDRAICARPEHDPHNAPIGKIAKARLEDREDHVVLRLNVDDTNSIDSFHHQRTGTQMVEVTFINDSRPFVRQSFSEESSTIEARVDGVNFQDQESFQHFRTAAQKPLSHADRIGLSYRRSLTPEPLIEFLVDYPHLALLLAWLFRRGEKFLRYTVDETLRKVGDDLSDALSARIRSVIKIYDKHRAADNRDVTSHIIIMATPEINLLTRGKQTELNTDIGLPSLCEQMEIHKDILEDADSVTFARITKDEDWRLLHIQTSSGRVIATAECYATTLRVYDAIRRSVPICICLKHKTTGEECHYKTSAILTKVDEQGHFRAEFNQIPPDLEQWEVVALALEA